MEVLNLSLKASVIQKFDLNPNRFSGKSVRMSHPMFKNGPFPKYSEKKIISQISLFLKQFLESWLPFQFNLPEKTEQILQQIL